MLLHTIEFNVKGVTFENEDGIDIQKEIKKILKEYKDNNYFTELYGGYTNKEIKDMDLNVSEYEGEVFAGKFVGDEYNGEDCFKIYIKRYDDTYFHIGYAPKEIISELAKWFTKEGVKIQGIINIVGGKYKYCEIYEEDYEEKERVATKELTYGFKVELNFYNENMDTNINEEKITTNKELEDTIRKQKIVILIIFILVVVGMVFFNISKSKGVGEDGISKEEYQKIQLGMSQTSVDKIVSSDSVKKEEIEKNSSNHIYKYTYKYYGEKGGYATITYEADYRNGDLFVLPEVTEKKEYNLK